MTDTETSSRTGTLNLILLPAIITLGFTGLRLIGELEHWPKTYFNPAAGGGAALIGITWLAPLFGIYFAVRLSMSGEGPRSVWRSIAFALSRVVIVFGTVYLGGVLHVDRNFYQRLVYIWLSFALAALATWPAWPALFRTLVAYGYAARIPVVIVMFFAFLGNWGTHYDATPSDFPPLSLIPKWLWLGFFPQMILWVGFTIVTGMLFGTLTAGLMRIVRRPAAISTS